MKYLTLLVTLPVTVAVVVFAVNNRDGVTLNPWPFDGAITLPIFVVALVPFVAGFVLGGVAQWVGGAGRKQAARRAKAKAESETGTRPGAPGRGLTVSGNPVGSGG